MALPNWSDEVSPLITSVELAERLRNKTAPLMVDVREAPEFRAGHIPDAVNMPLSEFRTHYTSLPKDQEVVLVCRSDNRSGMAQQFLRAQGLDRTRNLIDGMLGWSGPVA